MPKKQTKVFDCIIVGSGASGVLAAHELLKKGFRVAMIDGGVMNQSELDTWFDNHPETTFSEYRRQDLFQRRLFLGENESVLEHVGDSHSTQMTSGWRSFVTNFSFTHLPLVTKNAQILQSLARGGLTEAWGGACDIFDQHELQAIGLSKKEAARMKYFYNRASRIVGMSGPGQKYREFAAQPAIDVDHHGQSILRSLRSANTRQKLKDNASEVYQPLLAVLTKPKGNREATLYTDLDFWTNTGKSLFRPHFLLEQLLTEKNFTYIPNFVVRKMSEKRTFATVIASELHKPQKIQEFSARKILLAAGAINSTKILLESLGWLDKPQLVMIKPHLLVPSLDLKTFGKIGSERQISLCQVVVRRVQAKQMTTSSYAQLYSYRSLLLYKLIEKIPLPTPLALRAVSLLAPSMVVADVRFSSTVNTSGTMNIHKQGKKVALHVEYPSLKSIRKESRKELQKIKKSLRTIGLFPFQELWMESGSSAHYAGGAPMSITEPQKEFQLSTTPTGAVRNFLHVFSADASSWKALPAKPPTFTIMANAMRVADHVAKDLRASGTSRAS